MASFYAGLWISGADKNYYSIGHDLASFTLRATERHKAGYALIGIRTYGSGKSRLWAGVWRAGTDANYFSVDKDITEFTGPCDQAPRQGSAPRRRDAFAIRSHGKAAVHSIHRESGANEPTPMIFPGHFTESHRSRT